MDEGDGCLGDGFGVSHGMIMAFWVWLLGPVAECGFVGYIFGLPSGNSSVVEHLVANENVGSSNLLSRSKNLNLI